jgi:hypothetical protein
MRIDRITRSRHEASTALRFISIFFVTRANPHSLIIVADLHRCQIASPSSSRKADDFYRVVKFLARVPDAEVNNYISISDVVCLACLARSQSARPSGLKYIRIHGPRIHRSLCCSRTRNARLRFAIINRSRLIVSHRMALVFAARFALVVARFIARAHR